MLDSVLFNCKATTKIKNQQIKGLLNIYNNRIEFDESGKKLLSLNFNNLEGLTYDINRNKLKFLGIFNKKEYHIRFYANCKCIGPIVIKEPNIESILFNVIQKEIDRINFAEQKQKEILEKKRTEKARQERQKSEADKERHEKIIREEEEKRKVQREKEEVERRKTEQAEKERLEAIKKENELREKEERESIQLQKALMKMRIKNNMDKINKHSMKVFDLFLKNPYRILGVGCSSEKIEILKAQEKIIKLSKLGVVDSYKTHFDFETIEKPNREISVIQSSIANTSDREYKLFWFTKSEYIKAFDTINLQEIFIKANFKIPETYDCFLINYFWLLINDPIFSREDDWLKVFEYVNYFINTKQSEQRLIIRERFSQNELNNENIDDNLLVENFKRSVFTPIDMLIDNIESQDILIDLYRTLEKFDEDIFEELRIKTCSNMLKWFDKACEVTVRFYKSIKNNKNCTDYDVKRAIVISERFCRNIYPSFFKMLEVIRGYGTYSSRLEEKFFVVMKNMTLIIYYSDKRYEALKYFKLIYKYEDLDSKRVLRDIYGYDKFSNENDVLEFHKDDNLETLLEFAENGNANAQYALGCAYKFGSDESIHNNDESIYWINMAADQGHNEAIQYIEVCFSNDSDEMCKRAKRFANGDWVDKNYLKAIYWYEKSADLGNEIAQNNLGCCYYYGNGVEVDYERAAYWYSKASENNNAEAQYNLGLCYYTGNGVKLDYEIAFQLYTKSAELGNAAAQTNLAYYFYFGRGIEKNEIQAKYWWKLAAEQGDEEAKANLIKYFNVYTRDTNYEELEFDEYTEFEVIFEYAELGNDEAQYWLGYAYFWGNDEVFEDKKEARKWWLESAEQGNYEAKRDLRKYYEDYLKFVY